MGTLSSTTAFLTGGAGGIGRATCRLLLADGAHVTIGSRSAERLEAEAERLAPLAETGGGSIRWTVCDSLDEDQVRAAVDLAARARRTRRLVFAPGRAQHVGMGLLSQ